MLSFKSIFFTIVALTILSGAAATYLAGAGSKPGSAARGRIAERLAQIAVLGAGTLMALLAEPWTE